MKNLFIFLISIFYFIPSFAKDKDFEQIYDLACKGERKKVIDFIQNNKNIKISSEKEFLMNFFKEDTDHFVKEISQEPDQDFNSLDHKKRLDYAHKLLVFGEPIEVDLINNVLDFGSYDNNIEALRLRYVAELFIYQGLTESGVSSYIKSYEIDPTYPTVLLPLFQYSMTEFQKEKLQKVIYNPENRKNLAKLDLKILHAIEDYLDNKSNKKQFFTKLYDIYQECPRDASIRSNLIKLFHSERLFKELLSVLVSEEDYGVEMSPYYKMIYAEALAKANHKDRAEQLFQEILNDPYIKNNEAARDYYESKHIELLVNNKWRYILSSVFILIGSLGIIIHFSKKHRQRS